MTTKTSEARIYTGAEALRLLDGPVPGPYRSEWPLTREIVADFDGAVVPIASPASTSPGTERANVRLLAAAPDLAAGCHPRAARTV